MSWFGDNLSFEKFKLGNMWDKIQKNPEQLLLGAGDPFSAKVWSGITGKDYSPLVDQMGGATGDDFKKAEAAGIDTTASRQSHGLARVIAGMFAGNAAAGAMGGGGAAAGGAGAGSGGAAAGGASPAAGGFMSYAKPVMQGVSAASQAQGLLSGPPSQPIQQGQISNQAPDFSGLLAMQSQQDAQRQQEQLMRKQQQQQIMQGLLGAQYGR